MGCVKYVFNRESIYQLVLSCLLCYTGAELLTFNFCMILSVFVLPIIFNCAVYKKSGFLTLEFVNEILNCDYSSGISFEAVISSNARFVSLFFY